ncbi:unnamed protein product [Fusarium graminearum]|nr:unnamed protein product [Fusarium graminearum]
MTGGAFAFTLVNYIFPVICPETLHIVNTGRIRFEEITKFVNMVIVSRLGDELHSVSSQGIFTPVGEPLESQLAVGALVD